MEAETNFKQKTFPPGGGKSAKDIISPTSQVLPVLILIIYCVVSAVQQGTNTYGTYVSQGTAVIQASQSSYSSAPNIAS